MATTLPDHEEVLKRIELELIDGYDEELELEIEDRTVQELLAPPGERLPAGTRSERAAYFQELFRLQGELVKLQDWVALNRRKVVILFEGAMPRARAASSSASPSASIRASAASQPFRRRANASAPSGTSSATWRISPQAARSSSSTAAGTTARASSA